jgi:hypothetical protein
MEVGKFNELCVPFAKTLNQNPPNSSQTCNGLKLIVQLSFKNRRYSSNRCSPEARRNCATAHFNNYFVSNDHFGLCEGCSSSDLVTVMLSVTASIGLNMI